MSSFIVSRSSAGDRFVLQSDKGRVLIGSRYYATLDACKKGIASLVLYAPTAPLLDLTEGERGPNPKFEMTGEEGAYVFVLKSVNGKAVVTSAPYATKKACLRGVAMLRKGVVGADILLSQKDAQIPLTLRLSRETVEQPVPHTDVSVVPARENEMPSPEPIFTDSPHRPRLIRLAPVAAKEDAPSEAPPVRENVFRPAEPPAPVAQRKKGLFERLFKK